MITARSRQISPTRGPRFRWSFGRGPMVAGIVILGLFVVALAAPLLSTSDPNQIDLSKSLKGPGEGGLFGADSTGRDVYSRIIWGTRISLAGPLIAVAFSSVAGVPMGLLAALRKGWVDSVLSRFWDLMLAFPPLLLAIVIVAAFGRGFWPATIAIGIVYTPLVARVVRGLALVETSELYVTALRLRGLNQIQTALRHVLPNIVPAIVAQSTLNFGYALIDLAGLAFLGLGVQPPTAEWGQMLANGRAFILIAPHELIAASIIITIAVVSFNVMGDGLTNRLDRE